MTINENKLRYFLDAISEIISCAECPFYENCEGQGGPDDCVEFFLKKLQENS